MSNVVLIVEYNGTRYAGFQFQYDLPTIQGEIEKAIFKVNGESLRILAASRTDAGVHAQGQVVGFRSLSNLTARTWAKALNFYLPDDIAVKSAYKIEGDLNIRKEALRRQYRYNILNSSSPSPLKRDFTYHVPSPLNMSWLQEASQELVGEKDFSSFAPPFPGNTVRTVFKVEIQKNEEIVSLDIVADSFLPHQVRNTIGTLIKVGLGKMRVDEFYHLIKARQPSLAGPRAPAQGLCLVNIIYSRPLKELGDSYEGN